MKKFGIDVCPSAYLVVKQRRVKQQSRHPLFDNVSQLHYNRIRIGLFVQQVIAFRERIRIAKRE